MVEPPAAPVHEPRSLRGDYSRAGADYTVTQDWRGYSAEEHALWSLLFRRQSELVTGYAAPEFQRGVFALGASSSSIPRFEDTNRVLDELSGWQIVAVPGLIPEQNFLRCGVRDRGRRQVADESKSLRTSR